MPKKPKSYRPITRKSKKFSLNKPRSTAYDSTWQKYRRRFLHHNPNCYCCPNKSEHIDHIKAWKGDYKLFTATNNHLPLCATCHNTITGKFDRHKIQLLEEKIAWINKQREKYNNRTRVKVLPYYSKGK